MATIDFRILHTVDEMLPHFELVTSMGYDFTHEQYKEYLQQMIPNGYSQMIVISGQDTVAVAGFWINTKLYCGKYVELDNVIVAETHRSMSLGRQLCSKIEEEALKLGCTTALLDAYVENSKAHKFYFREGYRIRGYHFLKELNAG